MLTEKIHEFAPPRYSWLLLAGVAIANFTVYSGARFINRTRHHYILSLPLDDRIGLCTPFITIYVLAYLQWLTSYILAAHESREVCYRIMGGDIIAKLICFIIFLIVPTTLHRPEITGRNVFDRFTRFIYAVDYPDNLLPSIHCLESWICLRGSFMMTKVPGWYRPFTFIFTVLVFASTLLVKQHLLLDIPTAILTAEIGLALFRLLPL
ncbi:MAG: phosphatidic acid phosphatase [Blautia sp.]|nr:phosphatidic acid phosphatase [Blautia sp.]